MNAARDFDRYCLACRHSLRGLESRQCPECGRAFDPNDPRTTSAAYRSSSLALLRALSKPLIVGFALLTAACVIFGAMGRLNGWDAALVFMAIPLWGAASVLLYAAALNPSVELTRTSRSLAIILPIVFVTALFFEWPFRLSFLIHRHRLNQVADRAQTGPAFVPPIQIGLFRVSEVRVDTDGDVTFQVSGDSSGGCHLVRSTATVNYLRGADWWGRVLDDEWSTYYED